MSPVASWLASPPPDAAVEITPERVSAAQVSLRGKDPLIVAYATEPLPPGAVTPSLTATNVHDRAAVGAAVTRLFEKLPSRPKRVALVIPDTAAKISLVRFDRIPGRRDDFDQLVRWQVRKATPFPIEEANVTYAPGLKIGAEGREFLVVVARQGFVAEYEHACQDAGAEPGLVDVSTISLVNMYLASTPPSGDWLLVHVRPDSTSIVIMRGEDVIFYRNRAEGEQDSLTELVHQTSMYYQDRLSGTGFSRVLIGGLGRGPGVSESARRGLEDRLGAVVDTVNVGQAATLTDRVAASPEINDLLGPLVGISLRGLRAGVAA